MICLQGLRENERLFSPLTSATQKALMVGVFVDRVEQEAFFLPFEYRVDVGVGTDGKRERQYLKAIRVSLSDLDDGSSLQPLRLCIDDVKHGLEVIFSEGAALPEADQLAGLKSTAFDATTFASRRASSKRTSPVQTSVILPR
jgi:hypothetical protein